MSTNLFIVRHGKVNLQDTRKEEYLHLSDEGKAFAAYLDDHFRNTYFDHIFYQSIDMKSSDPYNLCRNTINGMKGVKTEFDKTQVSQVFRALNEEGSSAQNIMICFRAEAFNVISNMIGAVSGEQLSKEYHRVFQYQFNENNYNFVRKFSDMVLH
jgi:hypothetical protein